MSWNGGKPHGQNAPSTENRKQNLSPPTRHGNAPVSTQWLCVVRVVQLTYDTPLSTFSGPRYKNRSLGRMYRNKFLSHCLLLWCEHVYFLNFLKKLFWIFFLNFFWIFFESLYFSRPQHAMCWWIIVFCFMYLCDKFPLFWVRLLELFEIINKKKSKLKN